MGRSTMAASWCTLFFFIAVLINPSRGAQAGFFLADTYSDQLTSGQLTVSPFNFGGEPLGPKQTCLVAGNPANPVVQLGPCSSSLDTSSLPDKWAYNYSSNSFQSWGAAGSRTGPLMCLDAQSLDYNQGSVFTKNYLRATPCTSSTLQKWVWNGTTITLGNTTQQGLPDYWVAYKGNAEPFFALTTVASRAQSFSFVVPKDDASGTALYTPLPTQDYADWDIHPSTPVPPDEGDVCGDNCWAVNETDPAQCTAYCDAQVNPPCVAASYQGYHGCCYLKTRLTGAPATWFGIATKKAVYIKGSVYSTMLPPSDESSTNVAAIVAATVGASIGVIVLVCLILGYVLWKRRTERRRVLLPEHFQGGLKDSEKESHKWTPLRLLSRSRDSGKPSFDAPSGYIGKDTASFESSRSGLGRHDALQEWYNFEYKELVTATNGFSEKNVLGRGGCSTVYKGTLESGAVVAVKVMGGSFGSASQVDGSFEREVRVMARIRHKNLVCLRGCLRQGSSKIIVLDYCDNGSLADALSGKGPFLDWPTRLRVAEDAARGINYLHNDIVPACLHRDIKPANILLDAKLNALVADFGLAKHMADGDASQVETRLAGTFGFMAPECVMAGNATKAGDVFAFGGVLLVLITGKPIFLKQPDGTVKSLVQWILDRTHLEDPAEYADHSLNSLYSSDEIDFLLRLALSCVARPEYRPSMATVLRLLTELRGGKSPAEMRGGLPIVPDGSEYMSTAGSYIISPSSRCFFSRSSGFEFSEQAMTINPATKLSDGR